MMQTYQLFKLLADPIRMLIMSYLIEQESATVEAIEKHIVAKDMAIEQSCVSYHLRTLRDASLVDYRVAGIYHHYYCRKPDAIANLFWMAHETIRTPEHNVKKQRKAI